MPYTAAGSPVPTPTTSSPSITEYTSIKDRGVYAKMVPFAVNPNGHVNAGTLKNDFNFFLERGLVTGKVTVDQVYRLLVCGRDGKDTLVHIRR